MRKHILLTAGLIFVTGISLAGIAMATFSSVSKSNIQVVIDGKVINQTPKKIVKVRGRAGRHDLKIRVFNPFGQLIYVYSNLFNVRSGFRSDFLLHFELETNVVELKKINDTRIYVERLRRPDKFYNKQYIARRMSSDYPFYREADSSEDSTTCPTNDSALDFCSSNSSRMSA